MLFETAIDVFQVDVKPKVEGDFFGEVISASWTIRCSHLNLLPSLERNGENTIEDLNDGKEEIRVYLDIPREEEVFRDTLFLLHILIFKGLEGPKPYPVGLTSLILRDSGRGSNQYERVGRFWIDACPSLRVHPLSKQGKEEENVESEADYTIDVDENDNHYVPKESLWAVKKMKVLRIRRANSWMKRKTRKKEEESVYLYIAPRFGQIWKSQRCTGRHHKKKEVKILRRDSLSRWYDGEFRGLFSYKGCFLQSMLTSTCIYPLPPYI
jgi:hypothetical protein